MEGYWESLQIIVDGVIDGYCHNGRCVCRSVDFLNYLRACSRSLVIQLCLIKSGMEHIPRFEKLLSCNSFSARFGNHGIEYYNDDIASFRMEYVVLHGQGSP